MTDYERSEPLSRRIITPKANIVAARGLASETEIERCWSGVRGPGLNASNRHRAGLMWD